MSPLEIVKLTSLMQRTGGRPEIAIGPIDGPIAINHPDLASQKIHEIPGRLPGLGTREQSAACRQGTFVAAILICAKRLPVPAIYPGCTLLVRTIFAEIWSFPLRCRH